MTPELRQYRLYTWSYYVTMLAVLGVGILHWLDVIGSVVFGCLNVGLVGSVYIWLAIALRMYNRDQERERVRKAITPEENGQEL